MKLLYIWIEESENGFIKNQGVHLTPEYRFMLDYSESDQRYTLSGEHLAEHKDIWKTDNISGLTVIVGENGSGKTTLLTSLIDFDFLPNMTTKKMLIYEDEDQIRIIHNFKPVEFQNNLEIGTKEIKEVSINSISYDEFLILMDDYKRMTSIYLTNSVNSPVTIARYNGPYEYEESTVDQFNLTMERVRGHASSFYSKITMKEDKIVQTADRFYDLQSVCRDYHREKNIPDFQNILDVLYYQFLDGILHSNKNKDAVNFLIEHPIKDLHIAVYDSYQIFFYKKENKEFDKINRVKKEVFDWARKYTANNDLDIFPKLVVLLIFEMSYVWEVKIPPKNEQELKKNWEFSDFVKRAKKILDGHNPHANGRQQEEWDYYNNGLNEIKNVHKLLQKCPKAKSQYGEYLQLSYADNKKTYLAFCRQIQQFAEQPNSFVLKYLSFKSDRMSSGERALQNMFSWLLLPPTLGQYIDVEKRSIKKDVLLLIDEIDLYMHPEWQRRCLKEVQKNLYLQYPGRNIQLVVATHSPLVLSDVPRENTIYLKSGSAENEQPHLEIIAQDKIPETFGANIHQILATSFFLEKTIGEYAYAVIMEIDRDLKDLKTAIKDKNAAECDLLKEKCKSYSSTINMIGEPLIRRKLSALYSSCFPEEQTAEKDMKKIVARVLKNPTPEQLKWMREQLEEAEKKCASLKEEERESHD